ncbi:MAG: hypothetical protein E7553_07845 [Ruminococcaceae bacterium]|nr:hypothetical protein [Oscillospiraceae bacterium]
MAEEKFRRERRDRAPMHTYGRVMMVMSIVQIALGMLLYIGNPEVISRVLLFCVAVPALALAVLAAFMWPNSLAFRNTVRVVLFGVPLLVMGAGVFSAISASVYNPDSSPLYNWEMYGSIAVQFTQLIFVFALPALVSAASFGAGIDRVLLTVAAVIVTACNAFIVFYMTDVMGVLDLTVDHLVIRIVYVAVALVFAGMTLVPALGNDPDHTICKKD